MTRKLVEDRSIHVPIRDTSIHTPVEDRSFSQDDVERGNGHAFLGRVRHGGAAADLNIVLPDAAFEPADTGAPGLVFARLRFAMGVKAVIGNAANEVLDAALAEFDQRNPIPVVPARGPAPQTNTFV